MSSHTPIHGHQSADSDSGALSRRMDFLFWDEDCHWVPDEAGTNFMAAGMQVLTMLGVAMKLSEDLDLQRLKLVEVNCVDDVLGRCIAVR